ncbi:MAG TPA: DUF3089 domain-containing protein [Solirubrobacteraceae bacterium]|nr:DUF3089 domain-containing protein [Solirubrobacteraceae bacterium]
MIAVATCAFAGSAAASRSHSTWLCYPRKSPDPCTSSRTATVVSYAGETRHEAVERQRHAKKPAIDCFYVYPTVSEQNSINANLEIEANETAVAVAQASRFSQVCRVFAPVYRQLTLKAIEEPGAISPGDELTAYEGVVGAFEEYLGRANNGRGFVLIGHSQGAAMLETLIKFVIDPNPALRKQLVSAILLGGNVLVPEGGTVGGTFQNVPSCQSQTQTGCVIAYSSFAREPPANAFFGRPGSSLLEGGTTTEGMEVLCVNPALATQNGGVGELLPYAPTARTPGKLGEGIEPPIASTPWVEELGLVTGQCKHENGATWLQVSPAPADTGAVLAEREARHELVAETKGPQWGLHLVDVNVALGNLVQTVAAQAKSFG